jgi:uncharacterized protein involved in exopolysaccharide biosynthesis
VAAALIISLIMKPVYESTARILVRSSSSSSSSASQLASLAGINLGGGGSLGDLSELIKSRTVSKTVANLVDFEEILKSKTMSRVVVSNLNSQEAGELNLEENLGKLKTKLNGSFLEITVEHNSPRLSAEIANGYVNALSSYWNKLNYSEARKKKEYIEKQLPIVEVALKEAENKIKSINYLSGGEGMKNVQLESVEISRIKRELTIQGSIYMMLRNEYESAKLDEAKELSPFSDIEMAEIPTVPVKPKLKLNIAIGAVLGLFLGVFGAFFKDYIDKAYK